MTDGLEEAAVVEPVDPGQRGVPPGEDGARVVGTGNELDDWPLLQLVGALERSRGAPGTLRGRGVAHPRPRLGVVSNDLFH